MSRTNKQWSCGKPIFLSCVTNGPAARNISPVHTSVSSPTPTGAENFERHTATSLTKMLEKPITADLQMQEVL